MWLKIKNWLWWYKFVGKNKLAQYKARWHKALRLVRERMGW